jgi:hypothetical protein
MDKALVLADRLKKLKDQVESLATKQTEIQTIKGDQGPKGEQGDRGFDGAPGLDGRDGKDGVDGAEGKDGVSVIKAEIAFDGSLVLYLSNGDQIDCGEVTPAKSKEVFQTIKNSGGSSPIDIFTSLLPGLVPASGGGTANFLRADGTFAAPPGGAPASPTTSVQFNNGGSFGGSANFTYNIGTNTVSFGNITGSALGMTIQPLAPTSGAAGALTLQARDASSGNFNGGYVYLNSGDSTGTGAAGDITFQSGSSPSGNGVLFVVGGGASGFGGGISCGSGYSFAGTGGDFLFYLGGGGVDDGNMYFQDSGSSNFIHCKTATSGGALQLGFFNATPVTKPAPTATGTQAVLDSVVSSLNSLGLVDSAALTNATVITPAGADTQIQYNNAGVLGASANFTYSSALNTLSLGPATGTATFTTRAPTTAQNPSTFVIAAQNSIRTAGTSPGGPLTLRSGNGRPTGAGAGGALSITSGNAGTTGTGGAINLTAGAGGTTSGDGGAITILGGSPTSGLGGDVTVQSGPAAFLYLNGGNNPNGNGGDVRGQAGQGAGAGVANGGNFDFTGGAGTGGLGGDGGSLQFRGGGGAAGGAGGNGGGASFTNGTAGTAANLDGMILFYLNTSSGTPGSILLNSSFGTTAFEVTRNAGTSATEIGFFNTVPVTQPTTATTGATFVVNSGGTIHPTSTFDGYTLAQVVRALRNLGILA